MAIKQPFDWSLQAAGSRNNSKNILIFSTAYLPLVGGAEMAVKEISQRLPNWQFDMIIAKIQPGLARFERIGNVNVFRVGWGSPLDKFLLPFLGLFKAKKLEQKNHYSLIWSIMASQAGLAAVFFKIFYPAKKLLLNFQEGDPEEHLKRYALNIDFLYRILIRPWHLLIFKKSDYITAISNHLKRRAQKNGAKCPIKIVPNGVDIKKFKVPAKGEARSPRRSFGEADQRRQSSKFKIIRQNLRTKLEIKPDEKVVITVSRLVKKNGLDDLIKAIDELRIKDKELRIKLLIIGSGKDEQKLRKLVNKLNLESKVLFFGHVEHQDLPKYLALADVFVRPSLSEGLGNVFLEAMAAGLPVIGTPVGGIPDFLIDGKTGLFCKVKNPKDLAEKIELILANGKLRQKIITNAQRLVEKKYNWDNIALTMEKIFLSL